MDVGTGRFVQGREWSCPEHDYPQTHECDCDHCTASEWECARCAQAEWVDAFNEDGTPKMREVGMFEAMLMDGPLIKTITAPLGPFTRSLLEGSRAEPGGKSVTIPIIVKPEDAA